MVSLMNPWNPYSAAKLFSKVVSNLSRYLLKQTISAVSMPSLSQSPYSVFATAESDSELSVIKLNPVP